MSCRSKTCTNQAKAPLPKQAKKDTPVPKPIGCSKQLKALKVNDKILVCTTKGQETRYLEPTQSLCGSAFVQVNGGRIGYTVKDRFYVWTESPQTLSANGLVQFDTTTARQVLDCGNNWSNTLDVYTVQQTGLYQVIATVSLSASVYPANIAIAIQSTNNGDVSRNQLTSITGPQNTTTQALLQFNAGDQISLRLANNFIGSTTVSTRMLQIVQL